MARADGTASTSTGERSVSNEDAVEAALAASAKGRHDEALATIDAALASNAEDVALHLRRSGILEARAAANSRGPGSGPKRWQAIADDLDAAAGAATTYLERSPDAPNRDRVAARLAALRTRAAHAHATAEKLLALDGVATPAPETASASPRQTVDAAAPGDLNRRRRVVGSALVVLGVAGAGAGIGLVGTSLSLNFPAGCSDASPVTLCEDVGLVVDRARLSGGISSGVASALLLGIGVGVLVRTPRGEAVEVTRKRATAARVAGATSIVGGLALLATASALGVKAARRYDDAGALEETSMRSALQSGNAVLAVGVAGLSVLGIGAGLLAVQRPPRAGRRVALASAPTVSTGYFGWSVSGTLPW